MADKTYVVTAACAVIYNADRSAALTVYRGGAVPPGADPEQLELLLARGMVEEGSPVGGLHVEDVAPPFPQPESDEPKGRRGRAAESDEPKGD